MFITKETQKEIVQLIYGRKKKLAKPRLGFVEFRDGRLYAVNQGGEIGLSYPVIDGAANQIWFPVDAIKAAQPQNNLIWVDDGLAVQHDVLISRAFYGVEAASLCKIPTKHLYHYLWNSLPIVALKVGKNLQVFQVCAGRLLLIQQLFRQANYPHEIKPLSTTLGKTCYGKS